MSKTRFSPGAIEKLAAGARLADADEASAGLFVECLSSGKRVWKYRRRIAGGRILNDRLGLYPRVSIAEARKWAVALNSQVETGIDPQEAERAQKAALGPSLNDAHEAYLSAVERGEHRVSRSKRARTIKARTMIDKRMLYDRNVRDQLGERAIGSITSEDLNAIVIAKGRTAPVQANRLGAELRVFFKWALGIRGRAALGCTLRDDPTRELVELWHAEGERERWLDREELPIFLKALAQEPKQTHRRALLLILLTGCRKAEILECPLADVRDGVITIRPERSKNGREHVIELGSWGRALAQTSGEWLIQSDRRIKPQAMTCGWPKVIERVRTQMEKLSGKPVAHFTPHDLRRTMRSHIDELVDFSIAEKMLNHSPAGLEKRYNRNKRSDAMAQGFKAWDEALAKMARKAGVAEALEVPTREAVIQATPRPLAA